jgi:hypothetical protein
MSSTFLVCDRGYEHNTVLAAFSDEARALRYADEVRPLSDNRVCVEEITLDQQRRDLPGTWMADIWLDGTVGDVEPSLYAPLSEQRRVTIMRATVDGGERIPVYISGRGVTRFAALMAARQFLSRAQRAGALRSERVAASTAYAEASGGYTFKDMERQMHREHRLARWAEERAAGGRKALRAQQRAALAAQLLGTAERDSSPPTPDA